MRIYVFILHTIYYFSWGSKKKYTKQKIRLALSFKRRKKMLDTFFILLLFLVYIFKKLLIDVFNFYRPLLR